MNIKNLAKLEDKVGISFNNQKQLIEALSHISYLSENPNFKDQFGLIDGHNERLEHFGDSVLDIIIAENLFNNHPGREGELSKIKEHFAKGDKAEKISDEIGLEEFLIMGIGESKNKMGRKKRIKNSLEALIAAIFIDQGYDKAKEFVNKFFLYDLDNILENVNQTIIEDNPIGHLQEIVQAAGFDVPDYKKTKIGGLDHNPIFQVEIYVNDKKIAEAKGEKEEVKKTAAKSALDSEFIKNLPS